MRFLFLVFLSWVLLTPAVGGYAQGSPATSEDTQTYPGVSELGTRFAQLTGSAERTSVEAVELANIAGPLAEVDALALKISEIRGRVAERGEPDTWYVDTVTQFKVQFDVARKKLSAIQEDVAGRQKKLTEFRTVLKKDRQFWSRWALALKEQGEQFSEAVFLQADERLKTLEGVLQSTAAELVLLQERGSLLEQVVLAEVDRFSGALEQLRKATFRKNDFSFFSYGYFVQFNMQLWTEVQEGIRSALTIDLDLMWGNAWAYILFFLLLIMLPLNISRYRTRFTGSDEWAFVLDRPWAAGSFVSAVLVVTILPVVPPLVGFSLIVIGIIGATRLATVLISNRRQRRLLVFAAMIMVVTSALRFISLPQPLFRLFIAIFVLLLIPVLCRLIYWSKRDPEIVHQTFFRVLLRFGTVAFCLSLAGQVAGYVNFSIWLFRAVFETGMIVLFVIMGLRLGNGFIDFVLSRHRIRRHSFFEKYRKEAASRLERLFGIIVYFYALLHLLPVWRVFDSSSEVWVALSRAELMVGPNHITMQMVLLGIAALYGASQISWLLQTVCETQIFYRESVDRGVLDAIKRLIHYGVILVGVLVALSVLGMNLQHFVVILGALGVGIGFGLQDIVNNFLSGIILLFERPIKVGDGILVDGEYGTVKYIGLRSTIVETLDQSELIVPNAQMISQKVTNWTLSTRRVRVVIAVGVAYGSPVDDVLQILTEVSTAHPDVLTDPAPSPIFVAFGASSLDFELRVWIGNIDGRPRIKSELLQQIDARFRDADIQIPFPQRDLHLRSVDADIVADIRTSRS